MQANYLLQTLTVCFAHGIMKGRITVIDWMCNMYTLQWIYLLPGG